ncbi:hypothetical protein [Paenibacillus agri]|uniref:Uncharacterized protein n=1 Tax=Paenibacillus agri TaxID=2744309 RepID=A0A850ENW6_9BACL|nr:hypothetical protein [Paenibacillus agri]NUU62963.1 hypothetical protein [Paenibacillus agri]
MNNSNDTSWKEDNVVTQAQRSVKKLHDAVSQALSHPNEQTVEQAENRLEHTEQAVHEAQRVFNGKGAELAEELLADEKDRLSSLDNSNR